MSNQSKPLKFKRSNRTNYKTRLKLLMSNKTRLVVRPSSKDLLVQLVDYDPKGDAVRVTSRASQLSKLGWSFSTGNTPSAYLTGYRAARLAKSKKINEAVLDMGEFVSVKGSRIYAAVKGAIDGGLKIPCSPDVLPSEERISGQHIASYSKASKSKNQFSKTKDPAAISAKVSEIKKKIDEVKNV